MTIKGEIQMKKWVFTIALCAVALLFFAIPAAASDKLQLTHDPAENFCITAESGALRFTALPNTPAFQNFVVCIVNSNGDIVQETICTREQDGSAVIPLNIQKNGTYYLELFIQKSETNFASYFHSKDIRIQLTGDTVQFIPSVTLESNTFMHATQRTDGTVLAHYKKPSKDIQSHAPEIITLSSRITTGHASDYNKARAIHDWVAGNLWYDEDAFNAKTAPPKDALSTLKRRIAICEGYSNLTVALLRAADIPAKTVSGFALLLSHNGSWENIQPNEINHVWVEAYIDDRWIVIDPTWNSGNIYANGRKVQNNGVRNHRYFDATIEAFSLDHRIAPYDVANLPAPVAAPMAPRLLLNDTVSVFPLYTIEGRSYCRIEDLATLLQDTSKAFSAMTDNVHHTAYANNIPLLLPTCVINGQMYFKLTDLAKFFGFTVSWDTTLCMIAIKTQ